MNEKFICITIHTERLHNDNTFNNLKKFLKFLEKRDIKVTFFSINPSFVGYKFNEKKWIERLNYIKNLGHEIQQHTHFYKGKEGVKKGLGYDLSEENVRRRILEDKNWLKEKIRISPKGFVSGAFKINKTVFSILQNENFRYDLSKREGEPFFYKNLLEIPTLKNLKSFILSPKFIKLNRNFYFSTIYFHDYDLERLIFRITFDFFILFSTFLNFKFISIKELYERIKDINSSFRL